MPEIKKELEEQLDPQTGRDALAKVMPRLSSIPRERLLAPHVEVARAAAAAVTVARRASRSPMRERFALLPKELFDVACVDDLEVIAQAAWYARTEATDERAAAVAVRISPAIMEEATDVKARVMALCDYHLADDPAVAVLLDDIRPGTGYADLANDLVRLARISRRHDEALRLDTKNYRETDAKRADELAAAIMGALAETERERARWEMAARAWTLLVETYAEVAAAGRWIFRDQPELSIFGSIISAARRPRRARAQPAS